MTKTYSVYLLAGDQSEIFYIGWTKNIGSRMVSHRQEWRGVNDLAYVRLAVFETENEARHFEKSLLRFLAQHWRSLRLANKMFYVDRRDSHRNDLSQSLYAEYSIRKSVNDL